MSLFQFVSYHPLRRTQIARLNVREPSWSEIVSGNTMFSGKITIPNDEDRISAIKAAMEPDESALYIRANGGSWVWGGLVVHQEWSPENNEIMFVAVDWRSYFSQLILGPKLDGSGDILYSYNGQDQLFIARELARKVVGPNMLDQGRPDWMFGTELSGKIRDLNFRGVEFKNLAQQIDTMAKRDGGFEWYVDIVSDDKGDPIPRLVMYHPEKGQEVSGLSFHSGNISNRSPISKDTSNRKTRIWGVGDGAISEVLPYSQDTDPAISEGYTILKEGFHRWGSVVNIPTLSEHALAQREYLNPKNNLLSFSVSLSNPPLLSYSAGDRGAVRIKDAMYDINESRVRIIERVIEPDQNRVKLTLNLNDSEPPQVDEGGES